MMSAEEGGELEAADVERDAHLAQLLLQYCRQQTCRFLRRGLHRHVKANAVYGLVSGVVKQLRARAGS